MENSKKKFSKEEKKTYFENLRREWKASKALSESDMLAEALFRESGLDGVSYQSFYFVLKQMKSQKLSGLPYIDTKTFQGWLNNGYKVIKGQKSTIHGITWLKVINGKVMPKETQGEEDKGFLYPKVYHLFHKSQVEEHKEKETNKCPSCGEVPDADGRCQCVNKDAY